MEHIWTVLCANTLLDQSSKRPSLINCISDGTAAHLPANMPPLHIVSSWFVSNAGEYDVAVELKRPNGKKVLIGDTAKQCFEDGFAILDISLDTIVADAYGRHEIRVKCSKDGKPCLGHAALFMLKPLPQKVLPSLPVATPKKAKVKTKAKAKAK